MFNKFNKTKNSDDNHLVKSNKSLFNVLTSDEYNSDDKNTNNKENKDLNKTNNMQYTDKKKYINLHDFMEKNKCAYGDKTYTHNWWDNSRNILFKVNQEEYNEFLNIYSDELKTNFGKLHIMEKPLDIGYLCLDFDIKLSENFRCLEMIEIKLIIQAINDTIKKFYDLDDENQELTSYVLIKEKPYYDEDKKVYSSKTSVIQS